jgi:hypothetical protein
VGIADKLASSGPKKLLAIDGGGLRALITVEILAAIEDLLRESFGQGREFVLADYFDYIAGTGTGATTAAGLALGYPVAAIREFYLEQGRQMFDKEWIYKSFLNRYSAEGYARILKNFFGESTHLGSDKLRTLLMVVLKNATSDSTWFVTNNPQAKYNEQSRADTNLQLPLWQIVRASNADPTYFPPERVPIGEKEFIFVGGGVSAYNNPAFRLFLMATLEAYRLGWPAGEDRMLLVSIGAGSRPYANPRLKPGDMNVLYNATMIPSWMLTESSREQDFLCRVFGRCLHGAPIDREVGDMIDVSTLGPVREKFFTYLRYEVDITEGGLDDLGLRHIRADSLSSTDINNAPDLVQVGRAVASNDVRREHFRGFLK